MREDILRMERRYDGERKGRKNNTEFKKGKRVKEGGRRE